MKRLKRGIVYFNRANLYGVGGIPHLQWNGVDEIVGAGSPWWDRYDDYYPLVVDYSNQQTPYDIEITGAYISGDPSVPYEITVTQGGGSPGGAHGSGNCRCRGQYLLILELSKCIPLHAQRKSKLPNLP